MADKQPYGPVEYADPGFQEDGRKRYPLDSETHCRAAWSYINMAKNAAKYTAQQVTSIKKRIKAAGKKYGIEFADNLAAVPLNLTGPSDGWYRITAQDDGTEVAVYAEIGAMGITAGAFINDLAGIRTSTITLRLNSPGGEVFDGLAIYNALRNHPARVIAQVDGVAASIASVIAMAADHVEMSPSSSMMVHDARSYVSGDAGEVQAMADLLNKTSDTISEVYAERTGGSPAAWRGLMQATTWFNAHEAVDAGLADSVSTHRVKPDPNDEPDPDTPAALHDEPLLADWDPELFRQAMEEAAGIPDNATRWVAREVLDDNTCAPCRTNNGHRYQSEDAADADYPGGAGYVHCKGRQNCRGTIEQRGRG